MDDYKQDIGRLWKRIVSVGFAYVGIVTGAGLASGRELVEYFVSFGMNGMVAVTIVGVLHAIFGGMVLTYGSYYRVKEHSEVLDKVSGTLVNKFLDFGLIVTCFVIGFVMIAGAGSNLNQQYGIPAWVGSLICAVLTIIVCNLDFEKVAGILGIFTPIIFVFLLISTTHTFFKGIPDWNYLNNITLTMESTLPNPWVSLINYFSMCLITGASMAFVLGGEHLNIHVARRGGLLGGTITGIITFISTITIFARVDVVGNADLPALLLLQNIHPILGILMSFIIYGMIFNTAISLYYSLSKRFSLGSRKRFGIVNVVLVTSGFLLSFLGFKELLGIFYPILGYIGIVLILTLTINWIANWKKINEETYVRRSIFNLLYRKLDKNKKFTKKDQRGLNELVEKSEIENKELIDRVQEIVVETLGEENTDTNVI